MNSIDSRGAQYAQALAAVAAFVAAADPKPTGLDVNYPVFADAAQIRFYAHCDTEAIEAWQQQFGGRISRTPHLNNWVRWSLRTVVNEVPVEGWTLVDPQPTHEVPAEDGEL